MTYNPLIPDPTHNISSDVTPVQTNFSQANTIFGYDHYAFDDTTSGGLDRGLHKQIRLPAVSAPSAPTGSASVVYSTLDTGGFAQLFFQNATQTTQLTGVNTIGASGSIIIQGGIIIKWGEITGITQGNSAITNTVTFPTAFPNNCFVAFLSEVKNSTTSTNSLHLSSEPTSASFLIIGQPNATGNFPTKALWLAIGN